MFGNAKFNGNTDFICVIFSTWLWGAGGSCSILWRNWLFWFRWGFQGFPFSVRGVGILVLVVIAAHGEEVSKQPAT